MRTGTVASVDNRNWEIGDPAIIRRLSQSRAIALDMESAAIAANGFRFRVPYGTLLCVSDKPLHGEIKLAGMAGEFYRQRVGQHLEIGLRALEKLKAQEWERLHSRKLRSFAEVAFIAIAYCGPGPTTRATRTRSTPRRLLRYVSIRLREVTKVGRHIVGAKIWIKSFHGGNGAGRARQSAFKSSATSSWPQSTNSRSAS